MPKIRGIKPEFWTDEKVVEVSPIARLLFIGLWTYACDNGHIEDRPRQIKLRVLPADTENVDALLAELHDVGLIERANGWISIPTLTEHQKPDKRYFVTCDFQGCRDAKPVVRTRQAPPPDPEESPPDPLRDHDEPTPGPHRAHTVATRCLSTEGDGDGDGDGEGDYSPSLVADATPDGVSINDDFADWWELYPRKVGKGQAARAYRTARKKATAEALTAAIVTQGPLLMARGVQYCPHASTWLNGERWRDEPSALRATDPNRWTASDFEHLIARAERNTP